MLQICTTARSWVRILVLVSGALVLPASTSVDAQLDAQLVDGETCEAGKDCTCGNVTCNEGYTCRMTGPTGICEGGPRPEVPPLIIVVGGSVVLLGVGWLVYRWRRAADA